MYQVALCVGRSHTVQVIAYGCFHPVAEAVETAENVLRKANPLGSKTCGGEAGNVQEVVVGNWVREVFRWVAFVSIGVIMGSSLPGLQAVVERLEAPSTSNTSSL